jgi:hypothetical protein
MSEPKRYSIVADYQAPWAKMHEFNAGGWVKWEDYARLKADVERLTKAGDAMAEELIQEYGREVCLKFGWFKGWNAAKEGKPGA